MSTMKVPNDLHVQGRITAESMTIPAGSVTNASVPADASLDVDKLDHQYLKGWSQPNTAATAETRIIHVARSPGTVDGFLAGSIAKAVGDSTVTVDLKKNGTTVLTGVITLDNANTNRVGEDATISSAAYTTGDVFEIVTTATIGTGTLPTGVFCQGTFSEGAA